MGSGTICEIWPNLTIFAPLEEPIGSPDIVLLDAGGPGLDTGTRSAEMREMMPDVFDTAWVVVLRESWLGRSVSDACVQEVNRYMSEVRESIVPAGEELMTGCHLADLSTDMLEVGGQFAELSEDIKAGRVGVVGLSFGGSRVLDLMAVKPDALEIDALLLDSPVVATSAHEFKAQLARLTTAAVSELLGVDPEWLDSLEDKLVSRQDGLSLRVNRVDLLISLYAAAYDPAANEEWVRRVFLGEMRSADLGVVRAFANTALRHLGYGQYSRSWVGHFAEVCSAYSDWGLPERDPRFEAGPYHRYYLSLYATCAAWSEKDGAVFREMTAPCVIYRGRDPVAEPSSVVGRLTVLDDEVEGHAPLEAGRTVDELYANFWTRCAA